MLSILVYTFKAGCTESCSFACGRCALFSVQLQLFVLHLLLASSISVHSQLWDCLFSTKYKKIE